MLPQLAPGPIGRREFLRLTVPAIAGLSLAGSASAAPKVRDDTSVILVYCVGGASHSETYDLKPYGPEMIRSIFKPISTRVPGMSVCELLPHHARVAHRFSLIRSMHHKISIHNDGSIAVLTGKEP